MADFDYFKTELERLKNNNLYRTLLCIDSAQGPVVRINGRDMLLFCSNNYLNLAEHPRVIAAAVDSARKFGSGAAASRLISGTMPPHLELEKALADFLRKQSALIFPSGFTANEAFIRTIPRKGDLILLDKMDHASIIDAATASDADFRTFRRDSYDKLEKLFADKSYKHKFIITESVFSMDGDCADLNKLVELKNKYNAFLIVDEAHAFGCLGPTGAGLAEQLGLLNQVDIVIATMSKALGSTGGFIAGQKTVIEFLINKARAFIYTTAPSPVTCSAAIAALEIIKTEPHRRENLRNNADYLRKRLKELGLNTGNSTTHITPIIVGSEQAALDLSAGLYDAGFFIPAIRPPTVPAGSARLRISLQAKHTKDNLDSLCSAIAKYSPKFTAYNL